MVSDEHMERELAGTLDRTSFPYLGAEHHGKVRDSYIDAGIRMIVTTDRQSAFDRVVGTIPFKGQPLREWFVERGFCGDGPAPSIPSEVRVATASRYIALAEEITQRRFEPTPETSSGRVSALLGR